MVRARVSIVAASPNASAQAASAESAQRVAIDRAVGEVLVQASQDRHDLGVGLVGREQRFGIARAGHAVKVEPRVPEVEFAHWTGGHALSLAPRRNVLCQNCQLEDDRWRPWSERSVRRGRPGRCSATCLSSPDFEIHVDEPVSAGGTGNGPQPTDLLLASVASCFTLALVYSANKLGLTADGIDVKVTGTY